MAAPDAITAATFSRHLAEFRERVEQRRRANELNTPKPLTRSEVYLVAQEPVGRQFWEVMRAAAIYEQESISPDLAALCKRALARLGRDYLDAARCGDTATMRAYIEEGFPATYQDKRTGETAMHVAAGSQGRAVLRFLLPLWEGFTVRDRQQRLASELAYLYGEDVAMARLLSRKERQEAAQTASIIRRRPLSAFEQ
ncbi:MAG: hypothetical protein V4441_06620 [Pseudomonadota bacterium]